MQQQPFDAAEQAVPDELVRPFIGFMLMTPRATRPSSAQVAIAATIAGEHVRAGACRLTHGEIARRTGYSKRNVIRGIKRLETIGLIRVERDGAGNTYVPDLDQGREYEARYRRWAADWKRGVRRDL